MSIKKNEGSKEIPEIEEKSSNGVGSNLSENKNTDDNSISVTVFPDVVENETITKSITLPKKYVLVNEVERDTEIRTNISQKDFLLLLSKSPISVLKLYHNNTLIFLLGALVPFAVAAIKAFMTNGIVLEINQWLIPLIYLVIYLVVLVIWLLTDREDINMDPRSKLIIELKDKLNLNHNG